jgi:integrase
VVQKAVALSAAKSPDRSKTEAGVRHVPLAPMVLNALKAWKLACPVTPQGIVFPSETGAIHPNSNIHEVCWRPLLRAPGLMIVTHPGPDQSEESRYTFHTLRHVAEEGRDRDGAFIGPGDIRHLWRRSRRAFWAESNTDATQCG